MGLTVLQEKYKSFSDAELLDLAAVGPDALTADARSALASEMASRDLTANDAIGQATIRDAAAPLNGIQGWLALFTAFIALRVGAFVLGWLFAMYETGPQGWADVWSLLFIALLTSPFGYGLRLIWKRSPAAPRYWFVLLLVGGAGALLVALMRGADPLRALLGTAPAALWAIYWQKSERVTQTFGRRTSPRRDDDDDPMNREGLAAPTEDAPESASSTSAVPDQTALDGRAM